MRILVIGGMHGNEPLGLKVVQLFMDNPVDNVTVVLANEKAIEAESRFAAQDLNRSFPGDDSADIYESKRASQILAMAKEYDLVLDFHNTYCSQNDCGFVGDNAKQELYDAAWMLGLSRIIVADYDCVNKYALNCLSVEVSMDSRLNRPEIWYERIACLSRLEEVRVNAEIERYRFVYRMTQDDRKELNLDKQGLIAFQPIKREIADALNVKNPAYPIFVSDKFTPYNYGGIVNKLQD